MSRMRMAFDRFDAALLRHPWRAYAGLALLYLFLQAPRLFVVNYSDELIFPLDSIMMGQKLLFDGLRLRPALATMLITPVNSVFIYPPGLYVLAALLGSIKNLFLFLLVIQLPVPLMIYRLTVRFAPPITALFVAAFATYHFVSAAWWQPDFLIQPLMAATLLILGMRPSQELPSKSALVAAGLMTGLIIVLKHNIGLFFAILIGTWLLLSCIETGKGASRGKPIVSVLLAGFFLFAGYFAVKVPHTEEAVYFLLPYLLFWCLFAVWLARVPANFDAGAFFAAAALFGVAAIVLPACVFVYFAHTVGAERYFRSLFGMGMENVKVWDRGLVEVIATSISFTSPARTYRSLVMAVLYLVPFIASLYGALELFIRTRTPSAAPIAVNTIFRLAMLPVMAVFMLFPLEGPHILLTKLFVFILGAAGLLSLFRAAALRAITLLLGLALIPVAAYGAVNAWVQIGTPATPGGTALEKMIGLPVEISLATEFEKQLAVLQRTAAGRSFYVIDSSDGTLWSLAALSDISMPQHHVVMLKGLITPAVASAIKAELSAYEFVVVNKDEYQRFLQDGGNGDAPLDSLYAYVHENFAPVADYDAPPHKSALMLSILSFRVFHRIR